MIHASSVVHTISGLKAIAGGVARSVPGLCEALARRGFRTTLVSQDPRDASRLLLPDARLVDVELLPGYDFERLRFSYTPGVARKLARLCAGGGCVIHDHGIWLHMNHAVAGASRRLRVPRVVSPRGMLQAWSLDYRGWRKKVAWHAYQRRDLRDAAAFSATSHHEAAAIRAAGFEQPIAVIHNGIPLGELAAPGARKECRVALFMSRLHPKKGVLDLVEAWSRVRPPGWRLVIAGPDEGGHRAQVESAVARSGCAETIALVGAVDGEAKRRLLASAEIFVLPSYSENFGMVVGEALSCGVPAITTTATPWDALERGRCGWWIDTGAASLSRALAEATAFEPERLAEMGGRGRALVEAELSWDAAAGRHVAFYGWILGHAERPDFVV